MRRSVKFMAVAAGVVIAATAAGAAYAQNAATAAYAQNAAASTPKGWNYEIKDGKRVPKAERKVNADGSWREESRRGACVTVKEKTASGEYKETRRCD